MNTKLRQNGDNSRLSSKPNAGNVLLLVLIGVLLFVALSYVVTHSTKTSSGGITKEKSDLLAAEILNQLSAFDVGILRLTVSQACMANQLNPYNTIYTRNNGTPINPTVNPNSPSGGECNMWGGPNSLPFLFGPIDAYNSIGDIATSQKVGHYSTRLVNIVNVGSTQNDITIVTGRFRREVCLSLLKQTDTMTPDIPIETVTPSYSLSNLDVALANPIGDEVPQLAGKMTFILTSPTYGTSTCTLYHVLIAR